ncbi:MAG: hypothetical protein JOZ73_00250 [Solirubrobacterales bacterium]|nr:hypothetical protein [Solirubrobacterales bacterium]
MTWQSRRPMRETPASTVESAAPITEIVLVDGTRCRVEGDVKEVEERILDAARGSLMRLAWLTASESGEQIAFNPEYVVMLRGVRP